MSNQLSNPLQALINAAAQGPAAKTTVDAVRRHQSRAVSTGPHFILADISGSMEEMAGTSRKIDLLRAALLHPDVDWATHRLVAFHSYAEEVHTPSRLPDPQGSTALHLALDYIAQHRPAWTLVVSDGHPDDPAAAIRAADNLTGVVNVLYIGRDNDRTAIEFMRMLAHRTGGRVVTKDVVREKTLPATIVAGLLQG